MNNSQYMNNIYTGQEYIFSKKSTIINAHTVITVNTHKLLEIGCLL